MTPAQRTTRIFAARQRHAQLRQQGRATARDIPEYHHVTLSEMAVLSLDGVDLDALEADRELAERKGAA